ncbi:ATP-binding response regulator [Saccharicrinis fermentans]|uniref:Putative transcriptional regulatory protein pdtaR n=1 Tax=Saccharicrinis fermentans DSM 9555 = JCM 21142 TaxID=869213 RepID=W7Y3D6_9BACT|nr:response regulator [Saccharicrinis fermentans]GAF05365.1 putative transcriptional regulatory protein pdtaR [Saccharicrinis fermentans DSM 9555 = JCM 21142]
MRKVFIVEDDRFITAIFTMFLRDLGHELVGRTSSGKEAIEMCKELKPDVVLMDIHLEGDLDGIQTAEMLKRELEVPIIYISSDTSSPVIERAIVSNSYGYLVKPINKKELGISIDLAFFKHKVDIEQKERERGYREFISDSPMPIIVVRDGKITYLNRLGLDVFKTHYIEDVMGLPIKDFVADKSYSEFSDIIDSSVSKDVRIDPFLAKMKTVHGDYYWAEITGSKVKFNNHQSIQLIFRDVSVRKISERKNKVYEKVIFDRDSMSFVLNDHFEIVRSNAYSQKLLGVDGLEGVVFSSLLDTDISWLEELKKVDCKSHKGQQVEVVFKNNYSCVFDLYVVCSINGELDEIILSQRCGSL